MIFIPIFLARPIVFLPILLLLNLLFASPFLGFNLVNPGLNLLSTPDPYGSLRIILRIYSTILVLFKYLPRRLLQTITPAEENAMMAYLYAAETVLALVCCYGVLFFTPFAEEVLSGDGKEVEWWTTGRSWALGGLIGLSLLLVSLICADRK
jgi:hypothetical protein